MVVTALSTAFTSTAGQAERIQVTGRERLAWQQSEDALKLKFRIYVDGVGVDVTNVACARIAAIEPLFECSSPLPSMAVGRHDLRVAALLNSVEGERSEVLLVEQVGDDHSSEAVADSSITSIASIASGFVDPTDIAVAGPDLILVGERSGRVIAVGLDDVRVSQAGWIAGVEAGPARGLLSITATSPDAAPQYVFALVSSSTGTKLSRLTRVGTMLFNQVMLLELPALAADPHGIVRVGPDRKVYVALDDGGDPSSAGDHGSYRAKVLRLESDGTAAGDTADGVIYSMGLNRPAAMAWTDAGARFWIAGGDGDGAPAVAMAEVKKAIRLEPRRVTGALPISIVGLAQIGGRESAAWVAGADGTIMALAADVDAVGRQDIRVGSTLRAAQRFEDSVLGFIGDRLIRMPLPQHLR